MTGINQQPREASEARPGIGEYLLSMSAQLRAPLNAVIGTSGLLLEDDLSEKQRQHVNTMHAAAEGLSSTLNDLLDLARIAAGRLVIEPIPFDLKSMIEETASVLSPRANERGLALRVDLRPELPRQVVGDPGRTRQILGNLIGHAVNNTKQGEVVIRVLPDGDRGGAPAIRFVIEDTGVTIAPERMSSLFDDYVPVDAASYRSFGVTGLGLRISDELVRLMEGEIGADTEPGRGNRYWFSLPMPVPAPSDAATLEVSKAVRGGRVLIIEADPASRTRLTDQIESAGWDVEFSSDLESVFEVLREGAAIGNPFQACILSHYAVRPLHADLATRLKADQRLASVALVMATSVGSPGEAKKLWHAGFAGYLRKPVPTEEVHETLRALERVGADGRGPAMITRHLLAEVRNAQSFAVEGIDEMLATLTAAPTRRALVLGGEPADQESLRTATAAHGLEVETAEGPDFEIDQVAANGYEIVVLDTRFLENPAATVSMIRERLGRGGVPIVALAADEASRMTLVTQGIDDVLIVPVREIDAAATIGKWTGAPVPAPVQAAENDLVTEVAEASEEPVVMEAPSVLEEPVALEAPVVVEDSVVVEESVAVAAAVPIEELTIAAEPVVLESPEPVQEPAAEAVAEIAVELPEAPIVVESVATPPAAPAVPAGELVVTPVEGLNESLWEVEPNVSAIDGLMTAETPESAADGEVEPIDIALPSDELSRNAVVYTHAPVPDVVYPAAVAVLEPESEELPAAIEAQAIEISVAEPPAAEPPSAEPPSAEVPSAEPPSAELPSTIVGIIIVDQLAHGGGFFTQHLVVSFVREAPFRIASLATAATRGDRARMEESLLALRQTSESIGAARLSALASRTLGRIGAGQVEEATAMIAAIETGFHEVRQALETAGPAGLPAEIPAVSAAFLDQIAPQREGPGRMLADRLVASFTADAPNRIQDLREAVNRGDAEAAQRIAQTLKGMCGLIGAEPLAKLAALVEADARLKRVGQAERYLEHLDIELARVEAQLKR